jgi:hypothetical protein
MSSSFSDQPLEIEKRLMFLVFRVYRFFVEIAFFLDCTTVVLTDLRYLLERLSFEVQLNVSATMQWIQQEFTTRKFVWSGTHSWVHYDLLHFKTFHFITRTIMAVCHLERMLF